MQTLTLENVCLVGAQANPYDFTDKATQRQVVGTSYLAWFTTEHQLGAPSEVKINEAQYQRLVSHGFGLVCTVECELGARNNRVVYTARAITDAETGEQLRAVS